MAPRAQTVLWVHEVDLVFKEPAPALFRSRVALRQPAGRTALREFPHFRRTEKLVRQLEFFDPVQLEHRGHKRRLCVILNRTPGLTLQIGLAAIQHEDRIERRRIQRGRYAATHGHMRGVRVATSLTLALAGCA
jgi:hypothetical protein